MVYQGNVTIVFICPLETIHIFKNHIQSFVSYKLINWILSSCYHCVQVLRFFYPFYYFGGKCNHMYL